MGTSSQGQAPQALRAHADSPPIPRLASGLITGFCLQLQLAVVNWVRPEGYHIARSGPAIRALGAIDSFPAGKIFKSLSIKMARHHLDHIMWSNRTQTFISDISLLLFTASSCLDLGISNVQSFGRVALTARCQATPSQAPPDDWNHEKGLRANRAAAITARPSPEPF